MNDNDDTRCAGIRRKGIGGYLHHQFGTIYLSCLWYICKPDAVGVYLVVYAFVEFVGTSMGVQEVWIGRFIEVFIVEGFRFTRQVYFIGYIPSPCRTGARHIRVGFDAYSTSALRWPRVLTGTEGRSNVPHCVAAGSCARAGRQKTR